MFNIALMLMLRNQTTTQILENLTPDVSSGDTLLQLSVRQLNGANSNINDVTLHSSGNNLLPPNMIEPIRMPYLDRLQNQVQRASNPNGRISNPTSPRAETFEEFFEESKNLLTEVDSHSSMSSDLNQRLSELNNKISVMREKRQERVNDYMNTRNQSLENYENSDIEITIPLIPLQPTINLENVETGAVSTELIEALEDHNQTFEVVSSVLQTVVEALQEENITDIEHRANLEAVKETNKETQERAAEHHQETENIKERVDIEVLRRRRYWLGVTVSGLTTLASAWALLNFFPAPAAIALDAISAQANRIIAPDSVFSLLRSSVNWGANYFRNRIPLTTVQPSPNIDTVTTNTNQPINSPPDLVDEPNLKEPPSLEQDNWTIHSRK